MGEFGLDYERVQFCSIDVQKRYFELQFELAEALQLPLFLVFLLFITFQGSLSELASQERLR